MLTVSYSESFFYQQINAQIDVTKLTESLLNGASKDVPIMRQAGRERRTVIEVICRPCSNSWTLGAMTMPNCPTCSRDSGAKNYKQTHFFLMLIPKSFNISFKLPCRQ